MVRVKFVKSVNEYWYDEVIDFSDEDYEKFGRFYLVGKCAIMVDGEGKLVPTDGEGFAVVEQPKKQRTAKVEPQEPQTVVEDVEVDGE